MIIKKLVVGPIQSNCYIVGSEKTKQGIIVDPGADAEQILEMVNQEGLDIKFIVITHVHTDHAGAAQKVKEATGAQVCFHPEDAPLRQGSKRWLSGTIFGTAYDDPPPADRYLSEGDSIDVGNLHFTVLHTPGHSPGGICLLGEGVVFSGDTLFNHGIGRYDLEGGNYPELMNSIHTKLMVLPDETIVYTGHGPETTIVAERRGNPFLQNFG